VALLSTGHELASIVVRVHPVVATLNRGAVVGASTEPGKSNSWQNRHLVGEFGGQPSHIKSTTCAYNRPVCTEIVRKNFCDHETLAQGVRPRPVRSLAAPLSLIQVCFNS
jgi:hypothetical protein